MTSFDPAYFRAQGWWRDETLPQWLDRCAARDAGHAALLGPDGALTYEDLRQAARAFAAGLHGAGVRRGDVVAVQLPNVPEFLISWLAISELGAVMQTLHTPYGTREIEQLITHSGATICVALTRMKDRSPALEIAALKGRVPALRRVIAVGDRAAGTDNFADMVARGSGRALPSSECAGTDPFLLLYTSGTTASPKAVSVTHNHFLSNARLCTAEFGLTAADRILCLAPYTHLYGLYTLQLGLSVGATACLLDIFSPAGFIQALARYRPTILFAGPAHISPCLHGNLFQGTDLSSLRVAVLSGTTVPPSVSAALENILPNGKVLQAWGMTELQFGACSRPDDPREVRFETVGRATPGTQLRVADSDGQALPAGELGELHVRACSLFSGYLRNEEANRAGFVADGWFRTGDLASLDAHGNVRLSGRTKELINRGGIKFNPIDMEIALSAHPRIGQVAIAPLPDAMLGERAACFVVLKSGASLSFDELLQFLAERKFAKFTWPESLVVVEEMPMTPTRKVMKAELVRRYLESRS